MMPYPPICSFIIYDFKISYNPFLHSPTANKFRLSTISIVLQLSLSCSLHRSTIFLFLQSLPFLQFDSSTVAILLQCSLPQFPSLYIIHLPTTSNFPTTSTLLQSPSAYNLYPSAIFNLSPPPGISYSLVLHLFLLNFCATGIPTAPFTTLYKFSSCHCFRTILIKIGRAHV